MIVRRRDKHKSLEASAKIFERLDHFISTMALNLRDL